MRSTCAWWANARLCLELDHLPLRSPSARLFSDGSQRSCLTLMADRDCCRGCSCHRCSWRATSVFANVWIASKLDARVAVCVTGVVSEPGKIRVACACGSKPTGQEPTESSSSICRAGAHDEGSRHAHMHHAPCTSKRHTVLWSCKTQPTHIAQLIRAASQNLSCFHNTIARAGVTRAE